MVSLYRIYNTGGALLGFAFLEESGMPNPAARQHGEVVQCQSADGRSTVRQDPDSDDDPGPGLYVRVAELTVHRTRFVLNPGGGETTILSLVMYEPFDELWDWPGFARFTGWNR